MTTFNLEEKEDYDVIKACISGDKQAFSILVSRYKNLVYSVILRMVNNPEEAADLSQEVFLKVYRNLDKYKTDYKFSTWIIKITTNTVIDYRRQKKQETVALEDVQEPVDTSETPEQAMVQKEQKSVVWGAVSDLPDIYKIPIVLYHQQGLSYQEISDITGEPLSKVKNRIFRGRKMLKDALSMSMKVREAYGM